MPRSGKELFRRSGIDCAVQLLSGVIIERAVRESHLRVQPRERRARPRDVSTWRRNAEDTDGAARLQRSPPPRLRVRENRAPNSTRPAGHHHHDLPGKVEPRQIVVVLRWNGEPVSREDKARFGQWRIVDTNVDRQIFAERQLLFRAVAEETHARAVLHDPAAGERNRLEETLFSAGTKPGLAEHPRDVLRGEAMLRASGLAASHAVIGEVLYVGPPAFGLGETRLGESRKESDGKQRCADRSSHSSSPERLAVRWIRNTPVGNKWAATHIPATATENCQSCPPPAESCQRRSSRTSGRHLWRAGKAVACSLKRAGERPDVVS